MVTPKILWIASQPAAIVDPERFELFRVSDPTDALHYLRNADFDVVAVSLSPADTMPAETLLEEIQRAQPETPVVIHAPNASATQTVRLLRLGAFHVLQQNDAASLLHMAANWKWSNERKALGRESDPEPWQRALVGESRGMERVTQTIRLVARRRSTVLITGETGTGKEVVAQAIHAASDRARFPLVCVNCSALPESLLEAELFGHVRGAFTGATNQRVGRFEQAHHGTIFLDEIGDLPLSLQAKLLRVLQEREFQRLGSSETISVDLRVIAATNRDLPEMIAQGKFREDLYYRLNVVPISIPPLRERPGDVGLLVLHLSRNSAPRRRSR